MNSKKHPNSTPRVMDVDGQFSTSTLILTNRKIAMRITMKNREIFVERFI